MRKRRRIKNKFKFFTFICIIFIITYICIGILVKTNIAEGTDKLQYIEVHVKSGDTLWYLAKTFTSGNKDIRKTIYEISVLNQLPTSEIYPGQIIKIPIQ